MSKKIQTVIPDHIAKEIETVIKEDRFVDQSEFIRHCIREYLNHRETEKILDFDTEVEKDRILAKTASASINTSGHRDRVQVLREIVSELRNGPKRSASLIDIIIKAENCGIDVNTVIDMIDKLKSRGEIIEVANEKFMFC